MDPHLLNGDETAVLKEFGILLEPINPGTLRVPARFLRPASNAAISGPSPVAASSHSSETAADSDDTVELPETLESAKALTYIGFTDFAAATIFHNYQSRPHSDYDLYELNKCVEEYISQIRGGVDSTWQNVANGDILSRLGIEQAMADTILDPGQSRGNEDLENWLKDMLRSNHTILLQYLGKVKSQAILYIAGRRNESRTKADQSADA